MFFRFDFSKDVLSSSQTLPDICAEIEPRRTPPNSVEELLVQSSAKFVLRLKTSNDAGYSGQIGFETPDPFEVRNDGLGLPEFIQWNYDEQILNVDELSGNAEIVMKVLLPGKYRGEYHGTIAITEKVSSKVVCTHSLKSDPPIHYK
ncbi:hypothetical protein [Halomicrobium katesii]|uniref:hypothetical protein n=1 Tax=Halomicrobium katesii TaxID=437163 RepID=UPI0012BA78BA|nr:hypothetical protein [Halomicrobium katesii]